MHAVAVTLLANPFCDRRRKAFSRHGRTASAFAHDAKAPYIARACTVDAAEPSGFDGTAATHWATKAPTDPSPRGTTPWRRSLLAVSAVRR
jgi:hypothetical protein